MTEEEFFEERREQESADAVRLTNESYYINSNEYDDYDEDDKFNY